MTEKQLHKQICTYIKLQYPNVIFNTDLAGLRMTYGQAKDVKHLRSSNSFPDLIIYENNWLHSALFLEIKKETPYKKDGSLKKNEHLQAQNKMLSELRKRGYQALFVWSFEAAKKIIDEYLIDEFKG